MQTCVKNLKTEEDRVVLNSIEDLFTIDCQVFVLNRQFYGQIGSVKRVTEGGSILLNIKNQTDIIQFDQDNKSETFKWVVGWKLANYCGISSYLLSRLTGTLFLHGPGKARTMGNATFMRSLIYTNYDIFHRRERKAKYRIGT